MGDDINLDEMGEDKSEGEVDEMGDFDEDMGDFDESDNFLNSNE
jgi:hypothetical protein